MNATTYGLDAAKQIVQMYWVDAQTGEIANRRFRRDELITFLARRPAGRVALEACGSAHWWARKIKALGHEVVLLHAKFIRPFVQTNKTDAADARAIWTAVHQPRMRTVAAKTEDQQAMLGLHRMRSLLIKFRTIQVNQLRGLLYEFGVPFRVGRVAGHHDEQSAGPVEAGRRDRAGHRSAGEADKRLAQAGSGVPGNRGGARYRQAHRDCADRYDRGCKNVQIRP
jgi:transposase